MSVNWYSFGAAHNTAKCVGIKEINGVTKYSLKFDDDSEGLYSEEYLKKRIAEDLVVTNLSVDDNGKIVKILNNYGPFGMIKDIANCKCIQKDRDKNGVIVNYKIQDNQGTVYDMEPKQLKSMIFNGNIIVFNLKLTSDGRLIDKEEKEQNSKGYISVSGKYEEEVVQRALLHAVVAYKDTINMTLMSSKSSLCMDKNEFILNGASIENLTKLGLNDIESYHKIRFDATLTKKKMPNRNKVMADIDFKITATGNTKGQEDKVLVTFSKLVNNVMDRIELAAYRAGVTQEFETLFGMSLCVILEIIRSGLNKLEYDSGVIINRVVANIEKADQSRLVMTNRVNASTNKNPNSLYNLVNIMSKALLGYTFNESAGGISPIHDAIEKEHIDKIKANDIRIGANVGKTNKDKGSDKLAVARAISDTMLSEANKEANDKVVGEPQIADEDMSLFEKAIKRLIFYVFKQIRENGDNVEIGTVEINGQKVAGTKASELTPEEINELEDIVDGTVSGMFKMFRRENKKGNVKPFSVGSINVNGKKLK